MCNQTLHSTKSKITALNMTRMRSNLPTASKLRVLFFFVCFIFLVAGHYKHIHTLRWNGDAFFLLCNKLKLINIKHSLKNDQECLIRVVHWNVYKERIVNILMKIVELQCISIRVVLVQGQLFLLKKNLLKWFWIFIQWPFLATEHWLNHIQKNSPLNCKHFVYMKYADCIYYQYNSCTNFVWFHFGCCFNTII